MISKVSKTNPISSFSYSSRSSTSSSSANKRNATSSTAWAVPASKLRRFPVSSASKSIVSRNWRSSTIVSFYIHHKRLRPPLPTSTSCNSNISFPLWHCLSLLPHHHSLGALLRMAKMIMMTTTTTTRSSRNMLIVDIQVSKNPLNRMDYYVQSTLWILFSNEEILICLFTIRATHTSTTFLVS